MNLEELTIGQAKQLASLLGGLGGTQQCGPIGKYCVVRTYSAGVHVGVLKSMQGKQVALTESKRIWSWVGANTLSEMSLNGIESASKVSEQVEEIFLSEAIEVIPCTAAAEKNLRGKKWAK